MGKVAYGFTSSIDGFIAGPGHDMAWMSAAEPLAEGTTRRLAERVAVIISGRRGYDAAIAQRDERDELTAEAYGGAWSGTEFILTHRPEDLENDPAVIALNCDVREAIRRAKAIAGDRDVQIISADIARQAIEHDLVDELQVSVASVFLGDGVRIFDVPGGHRIDWELVEIFTYSPRAFFRTYRPRHRPDLDVEREVAASAEQVWRTLSAADALASWWGPAGFTNRVREFDLRQGGALDIVMHAPDGTEYANRYRFESVDPPTRLTWIHEGAAEHGLGESRTTLTVEATERDTAWLRIRSWYGSDADRRRHLEDFDAESGARELLDRLAATAEAAANARH